MKNLFLTLILLTSVLFANASDIRVFFMSEPGNVFENLQQGTRAAMITMAEQGQLVESDNRTGGKSKITTLEDNYMAVQTSEKQTIAMRLLISGKDTVIAVIETVQIPVLDSRISFYDSKWNAIPTKKCWKKLPTLSDFIKPGVDRKKAEELLATVKFPVMSMSFIHENRDVLQVEQQLKSYLSKEEYYKMEPYLVKTLTYQVVKTSIKVAK